MERNRAVVWIHCPFDSDDGVVLVFLAKCAENLPFHLTTSLNMSDMYALYTVSQRRSAAKEALRREEVAAQARIRAAAQREREKTYTRSAGGESSESNSLAAPGNAEWGQSSRRHQNGDSSYGLGYAVVAEDLIV